MERDYSLTALPRQVAARSHSQPHGHGQSGFAVIASAMFNIQYSRWRGFPSATSQRNAFQTPLHPLGSPTNRSLQSAKFLHCPYVNRLEMVLPAPSP